MTAEKLHDAISLLPADLIIQVDRKRSAPRPKSLQWQRYTAMAACFTIIACSGLWCLSHLRSTKEDITYDLAMAPMALQASEESGIIEEQSIAGVGGTRKTIAAFDNGTADTISVFVEGAPLSLCPEDMASIAEILGSLTYDPEAVCNCIAPITVTIKEETYEINLEEGYVRCAHGQAILTETQTDILSQIFSQTP